MELIIYRHSWRRGGSGEGASLNKQLGMTSLYSVEHNVQCCLGQIACQGGIPLEVLMGEAEPGDIPLDYAEEVETVSIGYKYHEYGEEDGRMQNSSLAIECMLINDDKQIDDAERERQLIAVFAKDGNHTLRFVDGIAPWFQAAT